MSGDRPNVLLIMTDQQPVSTIGCYGNSVVQTPAQDRLAREGMRFDNFYIAAFPCTPSRATYLTGCYTHNHGVMTNNVELDDSVAVDWQYISRCGLSNRVDWQVAFGGADVSRDCGTRSV